MFGSDICSASSVWYEGGELTIIFSQLADLVSFPHQLVTDYPTKESATDLLYGIEEAIRGAQSGGVGLVVYFRKEGRALGEVTKYLVYNARKRSDDKASMYFQRTEDIAGVKVSSQSSAHGVVLIFRDGTGHAFPSSYA